MGEELERVWRSVLRRRSWNTACFRAAERERESETFDESSRLDGTAPPPRATTWRSNCERERADGDIVVVISSKCRGSRHRNARSHPSCKLL